MTMDSPGMSVEEEVAQAEDVGLRNILRTRSQSPQRALIFDFSHL